MCATQYAKNDGDSQYWPIYHITVAIINDLISDPKAFLVDGRVFRMIFVERDKT
jgi:hypothetical protein